MNRLLLIVFTFISLTVYSQTDISRLSFDFGVVRNYQSSFGNDRIYSLYPEVKVGGQFLIDYAEWEILVGYWSDKVKEALPIMDYVTVSHSSISIGGKLYYFPQKSLSNFPLPIYLTLGISNHIVNQKYIGGVNYDGNSGINKSISIITVDFGLGINFFVIERLRLRVDTNIYLPFRKEYTLENHGLSGSMKIGLDYFVKVK